MTSESKECSDAEVKMLIDGCISALDHAYCPYSNFYVGSSVLTTDGKMYTGDKCIQKISKKSCTQVIR